MLDRLLNSLRGNTEQSAEDKTDDLPRAVAALLVEAAAADEDYTGEERSLILSLLEDRFSLGREKTEALLAEAEAAQAEANDLYQFSRVVKDGLSREEKMKLIEDMWRVVLTDDHRDPHEEMVIRRLVGLIYLEDTDSAEARRRAERT
ncbi:TerB family tellurite resistance protein [Parvularcula maris]|uniref:TerB family tellurite resistance protein n=1 Tax=Parvularcula maris TaxID=2965077 RepID=A0A9X2L954_9PROT|nr:TerB family tellurite resistance protein [Parvularcula maris]MCQ8185359.1 TerB family tellurite resistance protein [Parvularcula maris]